MVCNLLRQNFLPRIFSHEYFQPLTFPKLRYTWSKAVFGNYFSENAQHFRNFQILIPPRISRYMVSITELTLHSVAMGPKV